MSQTIDIFGAFAPAYTISNENQRWATNAVSNVQRALTVAGSGDQAIFYRINGAKHIDTFDITNNARVIQDIKFVAIKNLTQQEYYNLIIDLFYSADIKQIPAMRDILPLLPDETMKIINTNGNSNLFGAGLDARHYPENIPSPTEYQKLKSQLQKPFNFVQCDLCDLNAKISGRYDLINISNIFDYCYDGQTQAKILYKLSSNLHIGGYIVYLPQVQRFNYEKLRIATDKIELKYAKTIEHNRSTMILFQRTR